MVEILTRAGKEKIVKDEMIVLDVLEQHAKESIGEIAKKCGFSHQKVWRIIKKFRTEEDDLGIQYNRRRRRKKSQALHLTCQKKHNTLRR